MELSDYVGGLRRELAAITRFAGEDITRAAEMLTEALDSSVRLTLLDVLSAAAAEITTSLDETIIDVRLSSGEPQFIVTATQQPRAHDVPAGPGPADADDAGTARITLRLPESLKARIEAEASVTGMSVNSWLVRAAAWMLDGDSDPARRSPRPPKPPKPPKSPRIGKRVSGYARS